MIPNQFDRNSSKSLLGIETEGEIEGLIDGAQIAIHQNPY